VSGQFAADAHVALARLEAVDRTDVVQSSRYTCIAVTPVRRDVVQSAARDVVARRRVRTRHHPATDQTTSNNGRR